MKHGAKDAISFSTVGLRLVCFLKLIFVVLIVFINVSREIQLHGGMVWVMCYKHVFVILFK